MFCTQCGAQYHEGMSFCPNCGTQLTVGNHHPSAAADPSPKPHSQRNKVIIISAIVAVLLVIAVAVVALHVKADADLKAEVSTQNETLVHDWQTKVDEVSVDSSDRTVLLANYQQLSDIYQEFEQAREAGGFTLPDGSECDMSSIKTAIEEKQTQIRNWFAADYQQRLSSFAISDGSTGDIVSRDVIQGIIDGLNSLQTDIESEKAIWGDNAAQAADNEATYTSFISEIDAQKVKANDVLEQVVAKEEAQAAEAQKSAQISTFQSRLDSITATATQLYNDDTRKTASSARQVQSQFMPDYQDLISDIINYAKSNCSQETLTKIYTYESAYDSSVDEYYGVNNTKGIISSYNSCIQQMINEL